MSSPSITLIAGATASGKSGYAMGLAAARPSVIINADALQIYDALPILTAQPSAEDQAQIPHTLYAARAPHAEISVKIWLDLAVKEIRAAWTAGTHPIVVGGTGMYLRALTKGLSPIPDIPEEVRAAARARQAERGNPAFHADLARIDPVMAARLKPTDTQRLIRAFEVWQATGHSLAAFQAQAPIPPLPEAIFHRILVDGPRDVLRARAAARLRAMIKAGVLDEVQAFADRIKAGEIPPNPPPVRALGYSPFLAAAREEITVADAIAAAEIETGQYIKRQQTWLRHQMTFDTLVGVYSHFNK